MRFELRNSPTFEPWPYVYFHRAAQDLADTHNKCYGNPNWEPPDLVACSEPLADMRPGIYDCTVYDTPARLYLWLPKGADEHMARARGAARAFATFGEDRWLGDVACEVDRFRRYHLKGLICLTTDNEARVYAGRMFSERADCI